jgi:hypothetical protein
MHGILLVARSLAYMCRVLCVTICKGPIVCTEEVGWQNQSVAEFLSCMRWYACLPHHWLCGQSSPSFLLAGWGNAV